MAKQTHVILDGIQDPKLAGELSAKWVDAGFANAVDPAGQCAWLAPLKPDGEDGDAEPLTEQQIKHAAAIARVFGLEIRERIGTEFKADNDLHALRDHVTKDYRRSCAQGLMFGLPALILHYVAPYLAAGGGADPGPMFIPWVIELLLVGWMIWAAGWAILWQGVVSIVHLRATADAMTLLLVLIAFVPSAVAVLIMPVVADPWFGVPQQGGGPWFHVAAMLILLAVLQRWLVHRSAGGLAGKANLMIGSFHRMIGLWLIASVVIFISIGTRSGWQSAGLWVLAIGLAFPPMASIGAIHPLTPGPSMILPVFAFAALMLFGGASASTLGFDIESVRIEIGALFCLMMTAVFFLGWRRFPGAGSQTGNPIAGQKETSD